MLNSGKEKPQEFELLKSIHDLYYYKNPNQIDKNDNILIKFLENINILKENKENISLFINELSRQIKNGNNLILPFINPCYYLIEVYINNDYNDIEWKEIFTLLIENSFFNRNNLFPIYEYFTELYSDVDNLNESDDKLQKFSKMMNLWNLLYSYSGNKNIKSFSTFCFMGTGLEISGLDSFPEYRYLDIKITFVNNNPLKYLDKNDDLCCTDFEHIKYSEISKFQDINSINFRFKDRFVELIINKDINGNEKGHSRDLKLSSSIKKLTILNNFYGEIKSIEISIFKDIPNEREEKYLYSKQINPFPLKYNGILFSSKYKFIVNNKNKNQQQIIQQGLLEIKVKDINLLRVNYINYKEEKNIIDYFGGINQFLPFLKIINGIYRNEKILSINNVDKDITLINFAKNILLIIFNYFIKSDKINIFKKYWNFFLHIFNKIEPFSSKKTKINIEEFKFLLNASNQTKNIFSIFYDFLIYINSDKDKKNEKSLIDSIMNIHYDEKNNKNMSYINHFEKTKTNNQLYRNIMKQLFVYNRLWSKQHLFFKNVPNCYRSNNKDLKIKYKRINYYTSNFQQPLLYPILEVDKYYPIFKKFKKNDLYKNEKDKSLNYDFSFNNFNNILTKENIDIFLDNNKITGTIKCCLIKKMYHIKGEIYILNSNNNSKIVFSSSNEECKERCNIQNEKDKNDNNYGLCYGSVFSCLEKDRKRLICIPKDNIMFGIKRIYYYRPSGLEIFTFDNKSYYFNFFEDYVTHHNKIIEYFVNNFEKIQWSNNNNNYIGWYNPNYSGVLNPLFNGKIDDWNDKNYYYSNFDKLMIINLFSNRSFNDLYQYPVFPMLYNEIGKKRKMKEPIGFQDLTEESKDRKQLIIDSYYYAEGDTESDTNDKYYFNLFYSNITYTCNYLIRVFPYSFIGIEYQGDGFDDPNRLFSSINSTFLNTLNQRADLRELVPEMFYFPPLFYNINDLKFGKISNGKEIDNVIVHDCDENEKRKYKFLNDMREYLENEENLDLWIDLIFGINKEQNEKGERYYNENSNIEFKNNPQILTNTLVLQSYDFGVLPYQLLKIKFPKKEKYKELEKKLEINKYNKNLFNEEHIECLIDGKISFICKGEKNINSKYLEIINNHKKKPLILEFLGIKKEDKNIIEKKMNNDFSYIFTGDVFGNLSVYKKINNIISNNNKKEVNEVRYDSILLDEIKNNYILVKILTDHTNEIKYIDYNPRLNLLVDCALDGFINLYTMPTLKLILSIQISDFSINFNQFINYVLLISNPFPMICCITCSETLIFDINGKLINKLNNKENQEMSICIDKNCGLYNDDISCLTDDKKEESILTFN